MKHLSILLLFLIAPHFLLAQKQGQALIDSLLKELPKAKEDTNKVNLLNQLSKIFSGINPDESIKYGKQGLALTEQLQWKKGEADADNNMGNAYCNEGNFAQALKNYFAGIAIRKAINDKNGEAATYNNIGIVYIYQGNYTDGLKNLFTALKIREDIGDKKGVAYSYNNIGTIYFSQGNYPEALKNYAASLAIQEEINDKKGIASAYGNIGAVYEKTGNYPQALKNHLDALKINEEMQDARGIGAEYNSIGIIYQALGNYAEALKNHFAALKLFEQSQYKTGIAAADDNIGIIYCKQDSFASALKYDLLALKIDSEIGNKQGAATACGNIGDVYKDQGQYAMALTNYFAALKIYTALNDTNGIAAVYGNVAGICYEQKKYKEAEQYATLSFLLAQKIGATEWMQSASETLSKIYTGTRQFEKALQSYKASIAYRDSITNKENTKKETQLQDKYDNDKKAAAAKAESDKQLAVAQEADKARLWLFGIVAAAILIILFLSFYSYRKREKDRFQIQLNAVQQEALNAQMSDHFIGNTMDSINGFIKNNDKEKASEYLILFSRLIRRVLENASEKMIPLKDDLEILKDYLELEKLRFPPGHLQYEISTESAIDMANVLVPPMVFQVLAENAIKHGFRKTTGGMLRLTIAKKNDFLECTVEDNGIGRRAAQAGMENANKERASYGGSLAEKLVKTGGKQTSYAITDLHDGNNNAAGTRVVFTLPYILAE